MTLQSIRDKLRALAITHHKTIVAAVVLIVLGFWAGAVFAQTATSTKESKMLDQLILGAHIATHHPGNAPEFEQRCEVASRERVMTGTKPPAKGRVVCSNVLVRDRLSNDNPGLYGRDPSTGFGAGFYRNSHRKWSVHADWTWAPHRNVDVAFGVVTGYERASLLPVVVPSVKYDVGTALGIGKLEPKLSYLHGFGSASSALHLSIEKKLNLK